MSVDHENCIIVYDEDGQMIEVFLQSATKSSKMESSEANLTKDKV